MTCKKLRASKEKNVSYNEIVEDRFNHNWVKLFLKEDSDFESRIFAWYLWNTLMHSIDTH